MLFNFRLRPLDQVTPWGAPEKPTLHWFGLTDGEFWIQSGPTVVLAPIEYQVVRLHEDMLTISPYVLEPVPADLQTYLFAFAESYSQNEPKAKIKQIINALLESVQTGLHPYVFTLVKEHGRKKIEEKFDLRLRVSAEDSLGNDLLYELAATATSWVRQRELDTSYLMKRRDLVFWSDVEQVHIAWSSGDSAAVGARAFPRELFIEEILSFHDRLMAEMAARIDAVLSGALPQSIHIDISGLLYDQQVRQREIEAALRPPEPPTKWDDVRAAIRAIEKKDL